MATIDRLQGLEILDSRGRPTVQAACVLKNGGRGTASVPSGASTGRWEAHELRDNDPDRYGGLGCRQAAEHISTELHGALQGSSFASQEDFDRALIDLDGTQNKSRLGANALLAASLAFARASAYQNQQPLYNYFAGLRNGKRKERAMPRPTINLFSGGLHAGGQVPIQDVLVVPVAAQSTDEALAAAYAVYEAAVKLIWEKYQMRRLRADEGGLAPSFPSAEVMLEDAVESIKRAGFRPGSEMALAIDVAASHFYQKDKEEYTLGNRQVSSKGMIETVLQWVERFPIVSVEDGLAEDDWAFWPKLRAQIPEEVLVLGDDLLCTNASRIERAVQAEAATALLLKVNQIGTVTEALDAYHRARKAGWQVTVSARSGETEDNWLADLAVGWQGDQIKIGSITQSERLAKYNRLLAIEQETGLPLVNWPVKRLYA